MSRATGSRPDSAERVLPADHRLDPDGGIQSRAAFELAVTDAHRRRLPTDANADRYSLHHAYAYAICQGRDTCGNANRHADSDIYSLSHTIPNVHADADGDAIARIYPVANVNVQPDLYAQPHSNSYSLAHLDADAFTHAHLYTDTHSTLWPT